MSTAFITSLSSFCFCVAIQVRLELQLPYADPSYLSRDLEVLETKHSALDAYLWLGYRLGPAGFPDIERAIVLRNEASRLLEVCCYQKLLFLTKSSYLLNFLACSWH
jgi:hypothetical protein